MNENNIKWVDVKIFDYFNKLPQNKISMDYRLQNLTPNVAANKDRYYECIFRLQSMLTFQDTSGNLNHLEANLAYTKCPTHTKVPDIKLREFYDRILYFSKYYVDATTLRSTWHIIEKKAETWWPKEDLIERTRLIEINHIFNNLFKIYNNKNNMDFSLLNAQLRSFNYLDDEVIRDFMTQINEKFTEKENNNDLNLVVTDDELEDIVFNIVTKNNNVVKGNSQEEKIITDKSPKVLKKTK